MATRLWLWILTAGLLCLSTASQAVDPFLDWQTLESPNFHIHYAAPHRAYAQHVADIAEAVHRRLVHELDWTPAEKTHLVLSDESDFANGFATVININRSVLFFAPPTGVGGLEDFDDWLDLLITHEYVHVLHLDRVDGDPALLRKVFGRFLLTFPNSLQPAWLIEGLSTYYETDRRLGIGRGQSTLFASMMRMEVARGILPVDKINLPIASWPAGAVRYLYGVYFFEFIRDTSGEEKIQQLVETYSANLIPFHLNTTFRRVYGKDVTELWEAFRVWLHQRFDKEIEQIRQQGIVAGEAVTRSGYRNGPVRVAGDTLYYIEDNGAQQATLVRLKGGEKQALTEVVNGSFDVDADGNVLISQLEVCDEYALYRDLYIYESDTDTLKRLTECGRYTHAVWSADGASLYAVRHDAGRFRMVTMNRDGSDVRTLFAFDADTIAGWFDVSPDNRQLVFSLWKPRYGWDLYLYRLDTQSWRQLTRDRIIQAYPEFTPDGSAVVYSAETRHAYNLFRRELNSTEQRQLTNTLGGAFQFSSNGDTLYYVGYNAGGSDIYRLEHSRSAAVFEPCQTDKPLLPARNRSRAPTTQSAYSPWPSLRPRWWFPFVELGEDSTIIGFTTSGNDALGVHNYVITPSYDFSNALPGLSAGYSFSNRFSLSYTHDNRLLRSADGQLNRIRSRDSLQLAFVWPQTRALSASSLVLALSWRSSYDNVLFNGASNIGDIDDNLLGVGWQYDSSRIYPLSISRSDGRQVRLSVEEGAVLNSDFSGQTYRANWQEYIGLGGEHVLALRAFQGWGTGAAADFRLGGEDAGASFDLFLNQSGGSLFGRRDYALRGYPEGLPQLRGRRARIVSAEWRFPGQRIERGIMAPPVGIMQWHGAVFVETGAAYDGSRPDRYYSSAGIELSADLNLFYLVPLRARLGLAHGFDNSVGESRLYLSLGSSF